MSFEEWVRESFDTENKEHALATDAVLGVVQVSVVLQDGQYSQEELILWAKEKESA